MAAPPELFVSRGQPVRQAPTVQTTWTPSVRVLPEKHNPRKGLAIRFLSALPAPLAPPLHRPKLPDEAPPECLVLLAVDQEFGKGPALRVGSELADPLGTLEIGGQQDVEQHRGHDEDEQHAVLVVPPSRIAGVDVVHESLIRHGRTVLRGK